jgi:RNA polymerase subunit RPABC4/transcription elongation factor Spt4
VTESQPQTTDGSGAFPPDYAPPSGDHALEVAARRGIGPLSPRGREVWHGGAKPCVSCGQLTLREAKVCDHCGQDLSDEMIGRMLAHAGPWYVLEHVRPFPGVSLERIIRQINRGLIEPTTIVRGPETGHQWRFAVETPGLCRFFGRCWNCHELVSGTDEYCAACTSDLCFQFQRAASPRPGAANTTPRSSRSAVDRVPRSVATSAPDALAAPGTAFKDVGWEAPEPDELRQLSAALEDVPAPAYDPEEDAVPRVAGVRPFWVLAALVLLVIVVLVLVAQWRVKDLNRSRTEALSGQQAKLVVDPALW